MKSFKNGLLNNILLIFLTMGFNGLFAQNTDLQLRLTPSVSYKINKKWQASFDYRLALDNEMSTFRSSMFQPALEYKIMKGLSLELAYRFTTAFSKDSHRLFATLQYKYKIDKKFSLSSATRYQFSTGSFDIDYMRDFKEPSQYIRQKFTLDFNVPKSKFSFYAAPELFLKLDSNPVALHRIRYHLGADYNLKYGNSIGLGVFYEDVCKVTKQDRMVFNIKYSFSVDELLKQLKKDKKKKKNKDKKSAQ
jgi:hypothetical protein